MSAQEKLAIEQQIKALQKELETNFSLSKNQIMDKKKLVSKLIAQKNKF